MSSIPANKNKLESKSINFKNNFIYIKQDIDIKFIQNIKYKIHLSTTLIWIVFPQLENLKKRGVFLQPFICEGKLNGCITSCNKMDRT